MRSQIIKLVNAEKEILKRYVGQRLLDSEAEVRIQAYKKLTTCDIKIEEFEDPEIRMIIIKEGMTDSLEQVQEACTKFLAPSIIHS